MAKGYGGSSEDIDKLEEEIKTRLNDRKNDLSTVYDRVRKNLEFLSGKSEELDADGRDGRSNLSNPVLTKYVNRIVNPAIKNKITVSVDSDNDQIDQLVNKKLNSIINTDVAREAQETALRTACSVGYGGQYVKTAYVSNKSLSQKLALEGLQDPTVMMLGPHKAVDGSDAEYGFFFAWVDKKNAQKEHGEGTDDQKWITNIYAGWEATSEELTPEMTYFYKTYDTVERFFLEDGSYTDNEEELTEEIPVIDTRLISITTINICQYVGSKKVAQTSMLGKYLPIVPTYGDTSYVVADAFKLNHTGIVDLAKTSVLMYNYYLNQEAELAQAVPLAPIVISTSAVEGHTDIYDEANKKAFAYLPYNSTNDENGTPNNPPMRLDNNPQIQAVMEGRTKAELDVAQDIGLPDVNFGEDASNQSGKSVFLRQTEGATATIHYQSNLEKSIKQTCRVIIDMLGQVVTEPEKMTITGEDGEDQEIEVVWADLNLDSDDFEIDLTHGAMHETKKREEIAQLMEVAQLIGDPSGFIDLIVEAMDSPASKKIVERIRKLNPALSDEQKEDPQAKMIMDEMTAQLEAKDQMLDGMEGQLSEMRAEVLALKQDDSTKIAIEQMKIDGNYELEILKQKGKGQETAMREVGNHERQERDMQHKANESIEKRADEAIKAEAENTRQIFQELKGAKGISDDSLG